ncbi:hypothetical protein QW131_33715 [Roseibium salinum]|nr:hypothetical protein [Roseibium salinum]
MDVQKYMSTDEHILGVHAYIISDTFFEGLTDDQKAIVLEAATLAARVENTQKNWPARRSTSTSSARRASKCT